MHFQTFGKVLWRQVISSASPPDMEGLDWGTLDITILGSILDMGASWSSFVLGQAEDEDEAWHRFGHLFAPTPLIEGRTAKPGSQAFSFGVILGYNHT